MATTKHAEMVKVRTELIERLRLELVGPNGPKEQLGERPTQRYLTGILWPKDSVIASDDDESFAVARNGEEDGGEERVAPLSGAMKPSSIGLSFMVAPGVTQLRVEATWGVYHKLTTASAGGEGRRQRPEETWERTPVTERWTIDLKPGTTAGGGALRDSEPAASDTAVHLEWIARPIGARTAVSLFLVNRNEAPDEGGQDPFCLFQPELSVQGVQTGDLPFSVRQLHEEGMGPDYLRDDLQTDELLYRNETVFAVGHGTAATWTDVSPDRQRAARVVTVTIPDGTVPQVLPPEWDQGGSLRMDDLAGADGEQIEAFLSPLIERYREWIELHEQEAATLSGTLKETAKRQLGACERSRSRMQTGLDLILTEPDVLAAFRFANRAMAMQRRQTVWGRDSKKDGAWLGEPDPKAIKAEWRPFQIAFILQALTGLVLPENKDRGIADLLWFPTGGGKTEAYLGLAAFALALRRLRGAQNGMRADAGVSIIMRYTLRLLTIQQFQRAAALICACEVIRTEDPDRWGRTPFRIGLWVGDSSVPNTFDDCQRVLYPQPNDPKRPKGTPIQLHSCPWCGHPLRAPGGGAEESIAAWRKAYSTDTAERRLFIHCIRPGCAFHRNQRPDGIPAVMIDEEIYRLAPSLLIGTVDKFARLPMVAEAASLFGRVTAEYPYWGFTTEGSPPWDDENRKLMLQEAAKLAGTPVATAPSDVRPLLPPDLIIQDELHLIGGPLGTMVGLYETAIDSLASRLIEGKWVGPKVVASTATIRQAEAQVAALFNRKLAIFPAPGIEAGHSFFAETQSLDEIAGRVYVGINAPGRSMKTALVRVYAALLAAPGAMAASGVKPTDLDPYQTVVGYFNSLRELGGAVRLMEDDVKGRIEVLARRQKGQVYPYAQRRLADRVPELTSRINSGEIPAILARLEQSFTGAAGSGVEPVDAVLASNMISVGVDVSRLGLMVVTGQPKTTAEYIQATSRVGREFPGLVVTVYNWARPRDLSHYERFQGYHSALYRYVEAISVTPFSARARDRGLAAVLTAMARLGVGGMAPWSNAKRFRLTTPAIRAVLEQIKARAGAIDSARLAEVTTQVEALAQTWQTSTGKGELSYTASRNRPAPFLLYELGTKSGGAPFKAPNSMRDVEASIGLYLEGEGE